LEVRKQAWVGLHLPLLTILWSCFNVSVTHKVFDGEYAVKGVRVCMKEYNRACESHGT
jgi:hypothetical protein